MAQQQSGKITNIYGSLWMHNWNAEILSALELNLSGCSLGEKLLTRDSQICEEVEQHLSRVKEKSFPSCANLRDFSPLPPKEKSTFPTCSFVAALLD